MWPFATSKLGSEGPGTETLVMFSPEGLVSFCWISFTLVANKYTCLE